MSTNAKVTVTVVVPCSVGTWGDDCTIGQIRDQAIMDAKEQLQKLFDGTAIRIDGERKVTAVWYDWQK